MLRQFDLDDKNYGRAYRRQLAALSRRELRITLCVYGMARVFLRSAQCAIAHEPDHLRPYSFLNHILNVTAGAAAKFRHRFFKSEGP
jgi:hypothetical protein